MGGVDHLGNILEVQIIRSLDEEHSFSTRLVDVANGRFQITGWRLMVMLSFPSAVRATSTTTVRPGGGGPFVSVGG